MFGLVRFGWCNCATGFSWARLMCFLGVVVI